MDNKLTSVVFVRKTNTFELKFQSGLLLCFLSSQISGLKGQTHQVVEVVNLIKKGTVLHWPELGLDIPVEELCQALLKGEVWSPSENSSK